MRSMITRTHRLAALAVLAVATVCSTAEAQRPVSPVGCFQDMHEVNGDIFGWGSMKIWKDGGRYVGKFGELASETGEGFPDTRVENIRYNRKTRVLKLDITFNRPTLHTKRGLTGIVSRRGIKMRWSWTHAEYGARSPFFRRKFKDCYW